MSGQTDESGLLGFGEEFLFQFFIRQVEGDIHPRTGRWDGVPFVKAVAGINRVVDQRCLRFVARSYCRQAALLLDPVQHQSHQVDAECRRRVVQRIIFGKCAVFQHRRQLGIGGGQERFLNDHQRDPGRAEVFLRAGVNHAEFADVDRPRQDVARHIGNQRHVTGFGKFTPLRAKNRVVRGQVHVGGVRLQPQVRQGRNAAEFSGFRAGRFVGLAQLLRFIQRFLGPGAGRHIGGLLARRQEVQRNHRKLEAGAALQEQYVIVLGDRHQFAQQGDGLVVHRLILLAAMAHLHDGHARAPEVEQLALRLLQHGQRQRRRSCVEVVGPVCTC